MRRNPHRRYTDWSGVSASGAPLMGNLFQDVLDRVPVFVLVVFRLAGMFMMTPVFSSPRFPRRVKALLVIVVAFGISGGIHAVPLPDTTWELAVGIGGEMIFGAAMGMLASFVFVAGQWAGEMIGTEMGLNMSEIFDPSMGHAGSLTGDLYYFLTLAVFLTINGHHVLLDGVKASFHYLPLLSLQLNRSLLDITVGMLESATILALRLASPMLITVLVVDLALGLMGRAMPQFNVMQAGLSVRSMVGIVVIVIGLGLTTRILDGSLQQSLHDVQDLWMTPTVEKRTANG